VKCTVVLVLVAEQFEAQVGEDEDGGGEIVEPVQQAGRDGGQHWSLSRARRTARAQIGG
jgi:hypothetical protein